MYQPKISGRISLYSEISPNARRHITESTRGHGVIVRIGWRIVVPIFRLNCMHIQAVVQETQAIAKSTALKQ